MLRSLTFAAALAVLPLAGPAFASDPVVEAQQGLDADRVAFQARMSEFAERARPIAADESLSRDEREEQVAVIWAEYEPGVAAYRASVDSRVAQSSAETTLASQDIQVDLDIDAIVADALARAQVALENIDIQAIVADAMADVDIEATINQAMANLDIDAMVSAALAQAQAEMANAPDLDMDIQIDLDDEDAD